MFKYLLAIPLFCLAATAQAADYKIDPDHTFITFEVLHNGTSTVRGRFDTIDGQISLDHDARTGQAVIQVDMASINTGSKGFDKHLQNEDFFLVDKFPHATFTSQAFNFEGDSVVSVDGSLEMLGQTQPVSLQAERFNCYHNKRLDKEVCGGDFVVDIMRSQWGMNFGLPGIPDSVRLLIEVEGIRQ